jgi:hypothetical protein
LVHPTAASRGERSAKLLEDTALARGMFGPLMDRAGFVEMTPAASMILGLGPDSIWILRFMKHDATRAALRKPRGMLEGDQVVRGRLTRSYTDHVREHVLDTIDPGDQVARSGWMGL